MYSIILGVLKANVGLLMKKGLNVAAENLKGGDITDEQLRKWIICEIEDVKSKLDGLARQNLLASISFYKEGLVYLYKVLDLKTIEGDKVTVEGAEGRGKNLASAASAVKTISLAEEMKSFQLTDHDGSANRALADAKDRFTRGREKATEAFCNEALSASDRILAIQYRVMATLLEKVDNLPEALAVCRLCLEELHSMPAVRKSLEVQLKQGLKSWLNKAEREEIIRSVCRMNRVIFNVTQIVGEDANLQNLLCWPCVDVGEEQVDPLCDARVTELLWEQDTEHLLFKPWSLVQPGDEDKEFNPCCITSNVQGQFFVIGHSDVSTIKVFERSGKQLHSFRLDSFLAIHDIAAGRDNWVYLLDGRLVYVFDERMNLQNKIQLELCGHLITASDNDKLFVVVTTSLGQAVQVYSTNGKLPNRSDEDAFEDVLDLTCTNSAERIMVLDWRGQGPDDTWVWLLNEQGKSLCHFTLQQSLPISVFGSIALHHASEHVFVFLSGCNLQTKYPCTLLTYHKGKLIRRIQLRKDLYDFVDSQATVTNEGVVAMFTDAGAGSHQRMVFVL